LAVFEVFEAAWRRAIAIQGRLAEHIWRRRFFRQVTVSTVPQIENQSGFSR
jgi:hypothetical protein